MSPHAIRIQLSKILKSEGFVHAKRMRSFLEFVVEETLAGRASQLCEYNIGISVFERDESFEPRLDPIVRNDARRLRQKLLEYYQRSRSKGDGEILIDIPKGSYVPSFSFVAGSNVPKAARQYRLSVRLIRIADEAELWAAEEDLEIAADSDEHRFASQFEVKAAARPMTRCGRVAKSKCESFLVAKLTKQPRPR